MATPYSGTDTVLKDLHEMPWQDILAGWGTRMGRKGSKAELPELATLSVVSMKLPSCAAAKVWVWCCSHALTLPDMILTSRAMASSPFSLTRSLAAILLPMHIPIMGSGKHWLSAGHCHIHTGGVRPKWPAGQGSSVFLNSVLSSETIHKNRHVSSCCLRENSHLTVAYFS